MENIVNGDGLKNNASKGPPKVDIFRRKEYIERNSLIDDMMNSKHMVTVYRMFVTILFGCVIHLAAFKYVYEGEISFGQDMILKGFRNFHRFAFAWICVYLSFHLVYYGFKYWATIRAGYVQRALNTKLWDNICLGAFVVYCLASAYFLTLLTINLDIPILLVLVNSCEVTRMLMKIHAFVRTNAPRVLKYKPHSENDVLCPTLSQFTYFLWIPALIYRDSYPRTKSIRWNYIRVKIVELVGSVLFMSVILERCVLINFKDYGIKPYNWTDITMTIVGNAGGGMLFTLPAFYIVLDIWMNIFAEICRFGDRRFYEDWWTSTNYERYYRTWNVIIHDWLYTYVYREFYVNVTPGNKFAAKYMVFFISAIFHEYILATAFGFVLPIVFIQFFVLGTILAYLKVKYDVVGNTFLLYSIGLGNAINISAFGIEYFARFNCPIDNPTLYSYLIPRMLYCGRE